MYQCVQDCVFTRKKRGLELHLILTQRSVFLSLSEIKAKNSHDLAA